MFTKYRPNNITKKKDLLENCFLASTATSLGLRCCLYILKGTETIHFSSFQYHFQSIEQARLGPKMGLDFNCTTMAIITVVPQIPQITSTTYHYFTKENGFTQNTRTQPYWSSLERPKISSTQLVRRSLLNKVIPEKAEQHPQFVVNINMNLINTAFQELETFCTKQEINPQELTLSKGLKFLTEKRKKRMQTWGSQ